MDVSCVRRAVCNGSRCPANLFSKMKCLPNPAISQEDEDKVFRIDVLLHFQPPIRPSNTSNYLTHTGALREFAWICCARSFA